MSAKGILFVMVALIVAGYFYYKEKNFLETTGNATSSVEETSDFPTPVQEDYSCSGKVHCSEMTSCEEATFYQQNCPGTKMDGDRDGIPCESQWCGH